MSDLTETILTGILTGLAADAMWESGKWAWKNREQIEQRMRRGRTIRVTITDGLGITDKATTRVSKDLDLRWSVRSRVSKDVDLRWKVEAPTPSVARRLEDLATWYLHVS